ncbi:hypothetical protein DFS33DRAFT_1380894 [Desarmillaria ectypa]|nr:hypothetical protein DFS33DRAFT_1380894 [Desarmillaria ectypa]
MPTGRSAKTAVPSKRNCLTQPESDEWQSEDEDSEKESNFDRRDEVQRSEDEYLEYGRKDKGYKGYRDQTEENWEEAARSEPVTYNAAGYSVHAEKVGEDMTKGARQYEEWTVNNARKNARESGLRKDERCSMINILLLDLGYTEQDVEANIQVFSSTPHDAQHFQSWTRIRLGLEAVIKVYRVREAKAACSMALCRRASIVEGILKIYKQ